jgi:hypothetical protein
VQGSSGKGHCHVCVTQTSFYTTHWEIGSGPQIGFLIQLPSNYSIIRLSNFLNNELFDVHRQTFYIHYAFFNFWLDCSSFLTFSLSTNMDFWKWMHQFIQACAEIFDAQ